MAGKGVHPPHPPLDLPLALGMLLNVCFLVLRLLFFEKFAGTPMAESINMAWRPHIARVKTKNILNIRIGLFKAPLSYVDQIVLRTDYLRGPLFVRGSPRLGCWGALVSALLKRKSITLQCPARRSYLAPVIILKATYYNTVFKGIWRGSTSI